MSPVREPAEPIMARAHAVGPDPQESEREVSFFDVVNLIWEGRYIIVATVAVVMLLAFVHMRVATPVYTASMVVMPVATDTGSSALASTARNLSPLLGMGLPESQQVAAFDMFRQALTSARVAARLDEQHNLLRRVFKSRWDDDRKTWTAPGGIVGSIKVALNWMVGQPAWTPPSALTLASYLRDNLSLTKLDDQSPFLRLEFSHGDPVFAANLLRWLHQEADHVVRQDILLRTRSNIDYLRSQLQRVDLADHRSVLAELVLREESKMMLISSDLPYAAGVLEPAMVSDAPTSPNPLTRLVIMGVTGLFLGAALVVGIAVFRGLREDLRHRRNGNADLSAR